MVVAAHVARSRQAARERAAQKEAAAAEAAALLEKQKAQEALEQKKRQELREVLQPGNDVKARGVVGLCPAKLFSEVDDEGMTPIHRAAATLCVNALEAMLRAKDLDKAALKGDKKGRTPLHHAVLSDGQDAAAVKVLAAHSDLELKDQEGLTPLQTAQKWGFSEAAVVLYEAGEIRRQELEATNKDAVSNEEEEDSAKPQDISHMAGLEAISEGRFDDARVIAANKSWRFPNKMDSNDNTVLHLAAMKGLDDVCRTLLAREDFVSADAANRDHATALHLAVGNKHIDCVRAIIECGRFRAVNARDGMDRTALHLAALRSDGEAYEVILAHKECKPALPDRHGKSAAEYAVERGLDVPLSIPETDIDL